MKKTIAALLLVLSLNAVGQKKDSTNNKADTIFVFSVKEMQFLQTVLMESQLIIEGKAASGKDLNNLMRWLSNHMGTLPNKEQPKK